MCGEHKPTRRRQVLAEFAEQIAADGTVVEKSFLGSVQVSGGGVDTKHCDSVYFADVRGSMPDLVQAVGPRKLSPVAFEQGSTAQTITA
ncbi:hypothetical protein [Streptomyces sp. NPDC055966]|uniref:hypothetical protein n=1 Tax=Streptomyces sp. NPDC055966 TaxID=3345669 RepID=UPI0035DE6E41